MAKAATDRAKAAKAGGKDTDRPTGTAAVLGRYLARSRADAPPGSVPPVLPKPTPERAVSTAIGRAAQASCGLPSFPVQARIGHATLAELIELLPDRALVLVVENHAGALGIVALSAGFLASLIEMQSMGRVSLHKPRERRPTRTDASIAAEFVNASLAGLAGEINQIGGDRPMPIFRFASFVDDPKPLELMLDDTIYHSYRLETRLGQGGIREGTFLAFLPGSGADIRPDHSLTSDPAPDHAPAPVATRRSLSGAVRAAPITLNAILCRKQISLRELRRLAPGMTIALPFDAMDRTMLETPSGQLLASGRLGSLHGNRAIRIAGAQGAAAHQPEDQDSGWGADNVFADGAEDERPDPAFAMEPPLGDMDAPDLFRQPAEDEGEAEDDAMPGLALPMNFIID